MSNIIQIVSAMRELETKPLARYAQECVKNEPMLFNCDADHAWKFGGPITRDFLDCMPTEWLCGPLVIDSRVHMLMKGWYPCIPGWHHDDVPRTRYIDGQPNYDDPHRSRHIVALVNGDICPTEFAIGTDDFLLPPPKSTVYAEWHKDVEAKLRLGQLRRKRINDRVLTEFNDRTWHQGTAAVEDGWRFFIRASRYEVDGKRIDRGNPRTNEVRKQVQVYMDNPFKGW